MKATLFVALAFLVLAFASADGRGTGTREDPLLLPGVKDTLWAVRIDTTVVITIVQHDTVHVEQTSDNAPEEPEPSPYVFTIRRTSDDWQ